ncbi:MAG: translation initiation factor IF-3 [Pseudomonadota bacterium]
MAQGGNKRARRNAEIEAREVRVIDQEGEQAGVMAARDALRMAQEAGLDLVEVSPNADPPVCRIMDYGKFDFERKKREREAKKKTTHTQIKEVKFRPNTDTGDYAVKLRNLRRFLEHGDKAKVTVRFRGREMAHQDIGRRVLERVREDLIELGTVEQFPKMEGRQMVMVISPKKKQ